MNRISFVVVTFCLLLQLLRADDVIRIDRILNEVNQSTPRTQVSLNGWWDFYPLHGANKGWQLPHSFPTDGWFNEAIIVPGSWTRGYGETNDDPERRKFWLDWRLFDSYGYPADWDQTLTAWYRRTFQIDEIRKDSRYFIRFDGVLRESWVYLNNRTVGRSINGILPKEYDVTEFIQSGENVLCVFCTDYQRDENGRTYTPTGADQMDHQNGIWQDVSLIRRPDLYLDDITIRTSVRRNELTAIIVLNNASKRDRVVTPIIQVEDQFRPLFTLSSEPMRVEAGQSHQLVLTGEWRGYQPWSPQNPKLYTLCCRLNERDAVLDERRDRFGFREVWIEGHRLLLNGEPIHLFGEWCHKSSMDSFRPEYVRQWYRMLKDGNMNYIRTHTYPHPQVWLDLADEMGILVSLESAWFFTHGQALDKEELWKNADQHVRDIIKINKNHPSIILWSVGNEVRWGWNRNLTIQNMPRLRRLYEELDPTRIPYHDGDSSLWDEREQPLISRHYGFECTGEEWWDKSKPLHVGEVGKWHYGQPIDNLIWGDDQIYGSFEACHRSIALECADLAEQARANEVTCFFPWNLSGLDNWRPWETEQSFEWDDYTSPFPKPLRSAPYSSEFAWWQPNSPGYEPGTSLAIMSHAFRPFAVVVREKRGQAFSDQSLRHTFTLINDTGGTVSASIEVTLSANSSVIWQKTAPTTIHHGYTERYDWQLPEIVTDSLLHVRVETRVFNKARVYDRVERELVILPKSARNAQMALPLIQVYGDGAMSPFLLKHNIQALRLQSLADADPLRSRILLIEKNAIRAGSRQNQELEAFIMRGGRVILLEQSASVFPTLAIDTKPVERVHIRGGQSGLLSELSDNDFQYWGDDPYGRINSDSWVVVKPYRKPGIGDNTIFLHSGYGDFGSGGLLWTPLFETRIGDGLLIACQLRVTEKIFDHPAALKLMYAMLHYAAAWQLPEKTDCAVLGTIDSRFLDALAISRGDTAASQVLLASADIMNDLSLARDLLKSVGRGKTLILQNLDSESAQSLGMALKKYIQVVPVDTIYNLVRWDDDILLEGISNQETFWLDRAQYSPPQNINQPMTTKLLRCRSAEPLLVSEYDSAWREFFTLGANAEFYRMPVMSHLLWKGERDHASGLLRIPWEQGEILLCQIPFVAGNHHAAVFWNQLFANLNVERTASLLSGEATIAGSQKSDGFPRSVRCLVNPSAQIIEQVMSYRSPIEYRLANDGLTDAFPWQIVATPAGEFKLEQAAENVLITFQIDPGRPRVLQQVVGGLPDPEQQTLLSLRGQGRVTVYINGSKHDSLELGVKEISAADIDLHQYWNTIVLHWQPRGQSFSMLWHNRQRQPEIEFEFQ